MKKILSLLTVLAALTVCLCLALVAPVAPFATVALAESASQADMAQAFITLYNAYLIVEEPPDGTPLHVVLNDEDGVVVLEDEMERMTFTMRFDSVGLSSIDITSPILDFPLSVTAILYESVNALADVDKYDVEDMFAEGTSVICEASNYSMAFESDIVVIGNAVTLQTAMLPDPGLIEINFGFTPSLSHAKRLP